MYVQKQYIACNKPASIFFLVELMDNLEYQCNISLANGKVHFFSFFFWVSDKNCQIDGF